MDFLNNAPPSWFLFKNLHPLSKKCKLAPMLSKKSSNFAAFWLAENSTKFIYVTIFSPSGTGGDCWVDPKKLKIK